MAAVRIFSHAANLARFSRSSNASVGSLIVIQKRWGHFKTSAKYTDPSQYTDYEVSKDPEEWKWVEHYLRKKTIPAPPQDVDVTISGWKPQKQEALNLPYFVRRTKNHMQPVYLEHEYRGMRKITVIRKIEGDIWKLESDICEYLEKTCKIKLRARINELAGFIKYKGDYVSRVKDWMDSKGL